MSQSFWKQNAAFLATFEIPLKTHENSHFLVVFFGLRLAPPLWRGSTGQVKKLTLKLTFFIVKVRKLVTWGRVLLLVLACSLQTKLKSNDKGKRKTGIYDPVFKI